MWSSENGLMQEVTELQERNQQQQQQKLRQGITCKTIYTPCTSHIDFIFAKPKTKNKCLFNKCKFSIIALILR